MRHKNSQRLRVACAVLILLVIALSSAQAANTKNVILMIGDGMGFGHVDAASYYLHGAAGGLSFSPYYKSQVITSLLNIGTYPFTDSAAAASALATGHKVNWTSVSQLSPTPTDTGPNSAPTTATPILYTTILEHAKAMGKRTGIIGTDPISRATPAAFGCHDHSRYRYLYLTDDLLNSSRPDVMLGGGATPTGGSEYVSSAQITTAIGLGYQVAYTKTAMDAWANNTPRTLGLFSVLDMTYELDRPSNTTEPHLHEMTAKALALLDNDPDGFFLMIEGAKIDYGAHANDIARTTWETIEFANSAQVVLDWMQGRDDTLLIVTADHNTGGLIATNHGQGNYAGATWTSTDHVANNVPVYAVGSNAELIDDYIAGGIMDNTNIFSVMYRAFTGAPYSQAPYSIFDQYGIGTGSSGNVYYGGGVFNNTFYTGQITQCGQQWNDHQVSGTALMNTTPVAAPSGGVAKTSIPMNGFPSAGGWLYISGSTGTLYRTSSWSTTPSTLTVPSGYAPEAICTDGTYLYMTSGTSTQYHKVFKYSVNHNNGNLTLQSNWPVIYGTSSNTRFRGISYYDDTPGDGIATNGKIYVVNHKGAAGTGTQLFEINVGVSPPTITQIGCVPVFGSSLDNAYQAVRYGDQIFVVGLDDMLHTFKLIGTTWALASSVNLGLGDLYGIGVKGDGTTAQYAWITHIPSKVDFVSLAPWSSPGANLADSSVWTPNGNGYPIYMSDAIVTAVNPTTSPTGFWIENQERTTGAHVLWNGTMPPVNRLVSLIGGNGSSTSSGEKTLSPSVVNPTATYGARALLMSNKTLSMAANDWGLANDGLLVKISGRVTGYNAGTGAFFIDDGSGVPSGVETPAIGIKILKADGTGMSGVTNWSRITGALPSYAVVTGVVRLDLSGDDVFPRIDARSNADIVITAL